LLPVALLIVPIPVGGGTGEMGLHGHLTQHLPHAVSGGLAGQPGTPSSPLHRHATHLFTLPGISHVDIHMNYLN
jgi:hypothetical protein